MKRRQFGAMLATAAFSVGGIGSAAADASAQTTEPLEIEDVSTTLGGVTSTIGRAEFAFQDGTMEFQVEEWSMEGEERSLSIGQMQMTAEETSAETFATLRAAMVESYEGRSASPLLSALAEADVNPESPVEVSLESVESDGRLVADQITATGTVRSAVPEGTRDLLQGGASLADVAALGPSEWSSLQVQRGDAELSLDDVTMELAGASVAVTAPSGEANVSGRTLDLSDVEMNVMPPETVPAEHVEFASDVRQLAGEGDLTLSAIDSAAADAGVTADNTAEAIEDARFDLSLGEVSEGGETLVANFETSGTLAELAQVLSQRV